MKRRKFNLVDVFDIQNLPDVPLRRVLYFLSVKDTRKLRCLSKWFERRITFLRKSIFNIFYINRIAKDNCEDISRTLSLAMDKPYAPDKLKLKFIGRFNSTMKQISVDYREVIASLQINVNGNKVLLLQPSFYCEALENLMLSCYRCNDDKMVKACEAMLDKHADNLKNLTVHCLYKKIRLPDQQKLDSLTLVSVGEEAAWTILDQSRPTISSLELNNTDISSTSLNNADANSSAVYQIPNIKHLNITHSNAFGFAKFNAENLVSLELGLIAGDIPEDLVWPLFPKLREFIFEDSRLLPILMNCRETLQRLVVKYIHSFSDEYASLAMPRLTDLYLNYYVHDEFTSKICSTNYKSLEFLVLNIDYVPKLDDGIRMESMRNVVLGCNYPNNIAKGSKRITWMCPNADVVLMRKENKEEIRHLVKSRCKIKNFSVDLATFFKENI